jgi:tetratricopeptide (TPR) repeat protein
MQHGTNSISKFVNFLFIIAVFGVLTTSINAQYGNLLSKKAADALAAGDPSVCDKEMQVLIDKDANNYAANIEQVRCFFLIYNSKKEIDGMIQNYIVIGKTEAYAREAIQANIAYLHKMIEKTTSANPNYAPAFNMSGLVYRMQGKNTEAEKAFARAIELEPSNFRPYANRAKMRDDLGNTAGAIADYEKVVALGINDPFIAKRLPELKRTAAKSGNSTITATSKNTAPTLGVYVCVEQMKEANGKLKSRAFATLVLKSTKEYDSKNALGDSSGTYSADAQGIITFKSEGKNDYFNHQMAYPSKLKQNRLHMRELDYKSSTPFTCDLVQTEAGTDIKSNPIYNLRMNEKPLSDAEETEIANEYASVLQNFANWSTSETTAANSGDSSISEAEMNKCVKDTGAMLAKVNVTQTEQKLVEMCKESIPRARQMVKDITENPDSFNKSVEAVKNASKTSGETTAMVQLLNTSQEMRKQSDVFKEEYFQASEQNRPEIKRKMIEKFQKALDELIKTESSYQNFTPEQKQTIGKYKNYYTEFLKVLNNLGK